jgi:hypothetical protein
MIDEYKEAILHELEKANDSVEVEQIINDAIDQFPGEDLYRFLDILYGYILQNELEKLSGEHADSAKWPNIRHALNYLERMNNNRSNIE